MNKYNQLAQMLASGGVVTASAIRKAGIPAQYVTNMVRRKRIVRIARGVYAHTDATFSETADLETVFALIPNGVLSLVSALRFHGLTDENPHELTIAIQHGTHPPRMDTPPVHFIVRSEPVFSSGVQSSVIHNTTVRVYSIEKTIADCFKYRNKIGQDIAIAALREAAKKNLLDYNKLWQAAKICRVTKIIRPYVEAVQ